MHRIRLAAILTLAALAVPAALEASPGEALWQAIAHVESRGDPHAYNPRDGALGVVQIRIVCVADANRLARLRGLDERFAPADRTDPASARRLWALYLDHYGREYEKSAGRPPTDEVYARIWNGGPQGWRKASTAPYWRRVRQALQ